MKLDKEESIIAIIFFPIIIGILMIRTADSPSYESTKHPGSYEEQVGFERW